MAMVREPELSMFSMNNHNNIPHHLMDWSTGEQPRGLSHGEDLSSSYMSSVDPYPQHSFSQQLSFDVGDSHYHGPKMEDLSNSEEFDYFGFSQVSSNPGVYSGHHMSGNTSFISQPQTTLPYMPGESQSQQGPGGVLEEIDVLLRHHQELDMDASLFSDVVSLPPQHQSGHAGYGHSGHGLGPGPGPNVSRIQWMDAQATLLARELHEQIMSDNSSMETQSMSSDSSALTHAGPSQAATSNFYSDAPRGPVNWGMSNNSSGPLQLATPAQQQMVIKQQPQAAPRMSSAGLGSNSFHPDPSYFNPRATMSTTPGFGSGAPTASGGMLQLQGGRSGVVVNPIIEQQALAGNVVPASGLVLVHLLLACAEAVADNKLREAEAILVRLKSHVQPDGNPMQRLAAYFEEALRARLTKEITSPIFLGLTGDKTIPQAEVLEAFSVFYDCIPIGKFGHLTCNQILLDAVEREKVVHVLDLHIWHGMQWPAFLQALALRPGGPPKLRMSAVGSDAADLKETGEKLHECANNLKVPFEFCPIFIPLEKFKADMLEVRRGEVLIVNSFVQFHGVLNKGPNSLGMLLGDLRRLNPRVMAFAENDGNHNSPLFLTRFVECLRYYSAVFDAFDASLPPDSPARMKMERIFAAQKIRNIIACEGPARVDGHETMKYWHKRMEGAHFRCLPLSSRAISQANLLLNLYYSNGYTLNTSECGYLSLGWHGMPLMGVSAWQ